MEYKVWSKGIRWKPGYRLQSQKFNGEWEDRHSLVAGISIFRLSIIELVSSHD